MTEGLENTGSGGSRSQDSSPSAHRRCDRGSARRARGLNFRNKKILILSFQPLSSELSFLRCLPYTANATQGRRINTTLQNNAAEGKLFPYRFS